jgi:3'-phosphoadenosine 5'-phosphosulfate (PAPS) 3'-phosphatase
VVRCLADRRDDSSWSIGGVACQDGYGGPWDVAAGKVLVEEAGGVVRHIDGSQFVLRPGKGQSTMALASHVSGYSSGAGSSCLT